MSIPLLAILTVKDNLRKGGRLELPNKKRVIYYTNILNQMEIKSRVIPVKYKENKNKFVTSFLVYFAKNIGVMEKLIYLNHVCVNLKQDNFEKINTLIGTIYGYPDCCIKMFLNNQYSVMKNDDLEIMLNALRNSGANVFPVYTNRFSPYSPILHLPHSFKCRKSVILAKKNLSALKKYSKSLYEESVVKLNSCVIVYKKKVLMVDDFSVRNNYVEIASAVPKNWLKILDTFRRKNTYRIRFDNPEGVKIAVFSKC